jgi:hypothetical protein
MMKPELAETNEPDVDVKIRLAQIAADIKAGAKPSKFAKEIDRLLGTELPVRNRKVEATWQADYDNRPKGE